MRSNWDLRQSGWSGFWVLFIFWWYLWLLLILLLSDLPYIYITFAFEILNVYFASLAFRECCYSSVFKRKNEFGSLATLSHGPDAHVIYFLDSEKLAVRLDDLQSRQNLTRMVTLRIEIPGKFEPIDRTVSPIKHVPSPSLAWDPFSLFQKEVLCFNV